MSTPLPVPPGFRPPLAPVTETNRSAVVYISISILLLFVFLSMLTRFWKVWKDGRRVEDWYILASALVFVLQIALSLHGCAIGLGSSITILPPAKQQRAQSFLYAAAVVGIPSLGLSRTSTMHFFCPLFKQLNTTAERIAQSMTWVALVWTGLTTLVLAFLPMLSVWSFVQQQRWFYTWLVLEIIGCGFEVACVIYAFSAYGYIQKKREANAGQLVFILCLPVVVIAITIVRLATFDQPRFAANPTLYAANFIAWLTAQTALSIIFSNIMRAAKIIMGYYSGFGFFAVRDWEGDKSKSSQTRSGDNTRGRGSRSGITYTQSYSVTRSQTDNNNGSVTDSSTKTPWVRQQQPHSRVKGGREADSISINSETRIVTTGDGGAKTEVHEGDVEGGSQGSLALPVMDSPKQSASSFARR